MSGGLTRLVKDGERELLERVSMVHVRNGDRLIMRVDGRLVVLYPDEGDVEIVASRVSSNGNTSKPKDPHIRIW